MNNLLSEPELLARIGFLQRQHEEADKKAREIYLDLKEAQTELAHRRCPWKVGDRFTLTVGWRRERIQLCEVVEIRPAKWSHQPWDVYFKKVKKDGTHFDQRPQCLYSSDAKKAVKV